MSHKTWLHVFLAQLPPSAWAKAGQVVAATQPSVLTGDPAGRGSSQVGCGVAMSSHAYVRSGTDVEKDHCGQGSEDDEIESQKRVS